MEKDERAKNVCSDYGDNIRRLVCQTAYCFNTTLISDTKKKKNTLKKYT